MEELFELTSQNQKEKVVEKDDLDLMREEKVEDPIEEMIIAAEVVEAVMEATLTEEDLRTLEDAMTTEVDVEIEMIEMIELESVFCSLLLL